MREVTISTTPSEDGEHRMLIVRRDDGFYRFVEEKVYRGDKLLWGPANYNASGLYETAEEAAAAAKAEYAWFAQS